MKILLFFLTLTFVLLAPITGLNAAPAAQEITVNKDELKTLIETLESDTGRTELLSNLKILLEQQNGAEKAGTEEVIVPLSEQLGIRHISTQLLNAYRDFLNRYNLDDSIVAALIATIVLALAGIGIIFAFRRLMQKLSQKLTLYADQIDLPTTRLRAYIRMIRTLIGILLIGVFIYTFCVIWDLSLVNLFQHPRFLEAILAVLNFFVVLTLAIVIWEAINFALSHFIKKAHATNQTRVKTLLPISRNIVFLVFSILFGLVLLSEVGVNVTPLLAGAGIVGVAVGFGAQNMVKDFLTGFIIILEDLIRVGDVVRIGNLTGGVEKITLRKVQMRGGGGTVFTVPFSAISTVENLTKEFSTYEFAVNVSYNTDVDQVFDIIKQIDEDMRTEEEFGPMILEPVEIWGVDALTDTAVVIKGKFKTAPVKQWSVQREFNKRILLAFRAAGIEQPILSRNFQYAVDMTREDPTVKDGVPHSVTKLMDEKPQI